VTAVARYELAVLGSSRRWIPPVLAYVALVLGTYAYERNDPGPSFAATAFWLCPIAAWMALALAAGTTQAERHVAAVNAGGAGRIVLGRSLAAVAACAPLAAFALAYPIVLGRLAGQPGAGEVAAGALVHGLCCLPGVAIAALLGPPQVRRTGSAMLGVVACLVLSVPADGLAASAPGAVRPVTRAVSPAMYTARELPRSRAAGTLASLAVASALFTGVALAGAVRLARARE